MPQINKIRIVNFTYNDGRRLIADELFDFSAKDGSDSLNVLINLANGGGKSVLVQLMLQPILPKATVAGRKIESFFTHSSDHCFILLEWRKDESAEKLLTGIAMAAAESVSKAAEEPDRLGVKFYTFFTEYGSPSRYDIQNLELSRKEKGRFIPADFDFVRALSKRSSGELTYYSMDDRQQWFRKLSEFGIYEAEWKTIETLNSEEGGLTKFFGQFSGSRQLLDKLLIPTIERKQTKSRGVEDNSLSTMLQSHVHRYATQQDTLHEKETYERFLSDLGELKPMAETLWNENDALESCVASLFGLSDAVAAELADLKGKSDEAEHKLTALEEELRHIEWERASESFYRAKGAFEEALALSDKADSEEHDADEAVTLANHALLVMECASYFEKQTRIKNEIIGLQEQIRQKESDSDEGERLAVLRASAAAAIRKALDETEARLSDAEDAQKKLKAQIEDCTRDRKEAERARDKAKDEWTRLDAKWEAASEETDREVDKLQSNINRFGNLPYASEELKELRQIKDRDKARLFAQVQEAEARRDAVRQELDSLPQKRVDAGLKLNSLLDGMQLLKREYEDYQQKDAEMLRICSAYSINPGQRFTGGVRDCLSEALSANKARQDDLRQQMTVTEEAAAAAACGSLHVPRAVIDYLNSTGLKYTTCEKYLLNQVADGNLTQERLTDILKQYPTAAYGILMQEADIGKLLEFNRVDWLPAMIPLFNYDMLERILSPGKTYTHAIAFYSEQYFANHTQYLKHLEEEVRRLEQQSDRLRQEQDTLVAHFASAEAFTYPSDWAQDRLNRITQQTVAVEAQQNAVKYLEDESARLSDEKKAIKARLSELAESCRLADAFLGQLDSVLDRIRIEDTLRTQADAAMGKYEDAVQNASELRVKNDALNKQAEAADSRLCFLRETADKQESARIDVGDGGDAVPEIDGSWEELYGQYTQLSRTLNDDLQRLKERLTDKQSRLSEYSREICKRGPGEDEYSQTVWSQTEEDKCHAMLDNAKAVLTEARNCARRLAEAKSKAEGALEKEKQLVSAFGEPLPTDRIGRSFDQRIDLVRHQAADIKKEQTARTARKNALDGIHDKLHDLLKQRVRHDKTVFVRTEAQIMAQYDAFHEGMANREASLNRNRADTVRRMREMQQTFVTAGGGIFEAFASMIALLESETRGDKYYSLHEQIQSASETAEKAIARIRTDLVEFDKSRLDLIRHCVMQGERIFEGLKQMAASSQVTVYDGKPNKQMIRFGIPDEVNPGSSYASVEAEIDKGTRELAQMLGTDTAERNIAARAEMIVGSQNLLRKYIGNEEIPVQAYKIDQNPENAGYRTWEQTQVNNSGAEKFVVYFAVILSLMNYTRSETSAINDRMLHSALILDNPFGSTSSKHILDPMFAIAGHFRVQMICLSDINKSDIINCFDIIIKAIVKKRPMSGGEILTHEGNEDIEHGFYRAQLEI